MDKNRNRQGGFTLVEFTVAVAIAAIILVGSVALLNYMVVGAAKNNDKTMAQLQVQYVGFWIGEDVLQAQEISSAGESFPLVMRWAKGGGNETITYDLEQTGVDSRTGLALGSLMRTDSDGLGNSTTLVGENLVIDTARCCRKTVDGEAVNVLVIKVDSKVDEGVGNATYEISPRYSDVDWQQCGNCTSDITT